MHLGHCLLNAWNRNLFLLYCSQGQVHSPQHGTQQGLPARAQGHLWLATSSTRPPLVSPANNRQPASPSSGVSWHLHLWPSLWGHSLLASSAFASPVTLVSKELLSGRDGSCSRPQRREHGRASGNVLAK